MKHNLIFSIFMAGTVMFGCTDASESSNETTPLLPGIEAYDSFGAVDNTETPGTEEMLEDASLPLDTADESQQDTEANSLDTDDVAISDALGVPDAQDIEEGDDASLENDGVEGSDATEEEDTSFTEDVEFEADISAEPDAIEEFDGDLNGTWWLKANPSSQDPCGFVKVFQDQAFTLTVDKDNNATGTLEPPGDFITLNFEGTLTGSQLLVVAEYTEAGPPSIGWATEHTYTLDVAVLSETAFEGTYTQEMVPNAADPCTLVWPIFGTKQ